MATATKYVAEMRRGLEAAPPTPTPQKRKKLDTAAGGADADVLPDELVEPLAQLSERHVEAAGWEEKRNAAGEFAQRSFFGTTTRRSTVMTNVMQVCWRTEAKAAQPTTVVTFCASPPLTI